MFILKSSDKCSSYPTLKKTLFFFEGDCNHYRDSQLFKTQRTSDRGYMTPNDTFTMCTFKLRHSETHRKWAERLHYSDDHKVCCETLFARHDKETAPMQS